MGMKWTEAMELERQKYRETGEAWEVMHEEAGFEDVGYEMDDELNDFDGAEMHLHEHEDASKPRRH